MFQTPTQLIPTGDPIVLREHRRIRLPSLVFSHDCQRRLSLPDPLKILEYKFTPSRPRIVGDARNMRREQHIVQFRVFFRNERRTIACKYCVGPRTSIAKIISYFLLRMAPIFAYGNGNLIAAIGFQPVIACRLGNLRHDGDSPLVLIV